MARSKKKKPRDSGKPSRSKPAEPKPSGSPAQRPPASEARPPNSTRATGNQLRQSEGLPSRPRRPNLPLLLISAALVVVWIGFLLYTALWT